MSTNTSVPKRLVVCMPGGEHVDLNITVWVENHYGVDKVISKEPGGRTLNLGPLETVGGLIKGLVP